MNTKKEEFNAPIPNCNNNTKDIKDFNYHPKIGLKNIGATNYMNATLQCLSNIEPFTNYFKYNPYIEKNNK